MKWILKLHIYVGFISATTYCAAPLFERKSFCFDDYNLDHPEDIHTRVICGKDVTDNTEPFHMTIVNMEYWRPNDKGDRPCQRSEDAKCCELWANDTIKCVVPVGQSLIEQMMGHCEGQSECEMTLLPKQLGHVCREQCNDSSTSAVDWCWSRILVVDYFCYQERVDKDTGSSTTFIIVVCILIPVCIVVGAAATLIIIKMRKNGHICCSCLKKRITRSTSYHVNSGANTLPRLPSQPNNYFVEAGAIAAPIQHQASRRTAGRNSFAIEPMYCDTEEMLSIRESMCTDDNLKNETTLSMVDQEVPGAMSDVTGVKNRLSNRVSIMSDLNDKVRRFSSESGIQFDASPSPPVRKESIVKEMVDNPFYKSLDELSCLPEEKESLSTRESSDTLNTDTATDTDEIRKVNLINAGEEYDNDGEGGDSVTFVKEGTYVRPKPASISQHRGYTAVNVSENNDINVNGLNSDTSESLLHVPAGFNGNQKRSVSPGLYVHISDETNPDIQRPFDVGRSASDGVILPIRKRHRKTPSGGMSTDLNQSMESVSSSDSSHCGSFANVDDTGEIDRRGSLSQSGTTGDSSTTDYEQSFPGVSPIRVSGGFHMTNEGQDISKGRSANITGENVKLPKNGRRKSTSSSGNDSDFPRNASTSDSEDDNYTINAKVLGTQVSTNEVQYSDEEMVETVKNPVYGKHTNGDFDMEEKRMKDGSSESYSKGIKLPSGSRNRTSSSSSRSDAYSYRTVSTSDSESDDYTQAVNSKVVSAEMVKDVVNHNAEERKKNVMDTILGNHMDVECGIQEKDDMKDAKYNHVSNDNYELAQFRSGNELLSSDEACGSDGGHHKDSGFQNNSIGGTRHDEGVETHDISSKDDKSMNNKVSVDPGLGSIKLPNGKRLSTISSTSSSDCGEEERTQEVDDGYTTFLGLATDCNTRM